MAELRAVEVDAKYVKDWLNPVNMSKLKRAVNAKRDTVEMNGHEMLIEYGHYFDSNFDGRHPSVKLSRADGSYCPFGYVRLKRIVGFDFENTDHEEQ